MNTNQLYHLEPPYGLINDPNAFLEFKGTYYLFFQWNPLAKDHSYKVWGYFTSKDLLNWDFNGKAIKPSSFFDRNGIYSGTGIVFNDEIYLYYTGNVKLAGKRKSFQNLATSYNGTEFMKEGMLFVTPKGFTEHVRDPKVFIHDNTFFMLLAAQEEKGTGSIILYTSPNPVDFKFRKILAMTNEYEMVECPDVAFFNGQALLNYALQQRDNEKDMDICARSYYKVVAFDFTTGTINDPDLDHNEGLIDQGFDFYVPQTLKLSDGRTIMVAWMSNMTREQAVVFGKDSYSIHCLSMFREIHIEGNHLYQKPIREYHKLFGKEVKVDDNRLYFNSRQWRLKCELNDPSKFIIKINDEARIEYADKTFKFQRRSWTDGKMESKAFELDRLSEIEIFSDTSSLEIYVNDGEYTSSSRIKPDSENCQIEFECPNDFKVKANTLRIQNWKAFS